MKAVWDWLLANWIVVAVVIAALLVLMALFAFSTNRRVTLRHPLPLTPAIDPATHAYAPELRQSLLGTILVVLAVFIFLAVLFRNEIGQWLRGRPRANLEAEFERLRVASEQLDRKRIGEKKYRFLVDENGRSFSFSVPAEDLRGLQPFERDATEAVRRDGYELEKVHRLVFKSAEDGKSFSHVIVRFKGKKDSEEFEDKGVILREEYSEAECKEFAEKLAVRAEIAASMRRVRGGGATMRVGFDDPHSTPLPEPSATID